MQRAWQDVETLLNEMRPFLSQAGIPERQLKMPDAEPDQIKVEKYIEIFDWLSALKYSDEYEKVIAARALRPEAVWANYAVMGITGLREQLILESANLELRRRWKQSRPHFFGRKYGKDQDKTTEQDPNQEGA